MRSTRTRNALAVAALSVACLATPIAHAQNTAPKAGIPVMTALVSRQDVPVVLRALGTIQPFQTVTVRARVDGTLDKVLFTEGQTVQPGDLLAELDPRPYQAVLDQTVARRAADEAVLTNARSDLARYAELSNAQVASRQKFEQARATVGQAEATVRGDEASIAAAKLNLSFTRITAPIKGRVGLRQIDAGNFIRAADPNTTGIVTITQIRPVALLFTLPQDSLAQVQAAMKRETLPVSAYSTNEKTQISEGKLLTIESAIDATTGTIKLKAVFANADEVLWPGQFVNVRLRVGTRTDVPTVPSAAVQRGPDGFYVYVVSTDAVASRTPVTVEQDDGRTAVLASGLTGGETIVVSGQSRLTNGSRVAAASPKPAS